MNAQPKILIVDDSAVVRRALKAQLSRFGALVTEAEDGQQGLEEALSSSYDLIISDVEMPRLNGFDLCEQLKGNPKTRGIPVIILSTLETDKDIERGFQVGAAAYVTKAEAQFHLDATIDRVLKQSWFQRGRLVLIADDSFAIRRLVSRALEEAGFQVMGVENGKQALEMMVERKPDLIISDIDMPEMNGIELCKELHLDPVLGTIPFVIMSGNSDRSVMRRLLQWGADSYLVKPFNLEQVVILVERLLSDHFLILFKEKERLDAEQRMMLESITSLIAALEARDPYTRGHSEAVAALVTETGCRMNFSSDEIQSLGLAARLHDIGKIGVPDSILLKPDFLSRDEFAVLRKHPTIGTSILGAIPSIKPLLSVIRHHHEQFDGSGYPDGLKGKDIALWPRMTAVADTYHALVSDRPYRRAMSSEQAMEVIEKVCGTQLCPECVAVFRDLPKDLLESFTERNGPHEVKEDQGPGNTGTM